MYVYIILGVAIVLVVLMVTLVVVKSVRAHSARKRVREARKAQRQAEMQVKRDRANEWIEQVNAAETDEDVLQVGVFPYDRYDFRIEGALKDAHDKFYAAEQRERRRAKVQKYIKDYDEASTPAQKAELCIELCIEHYLSDVLDLTSETVGDRIVELLLEELSAAQGGDARALLRFLDFRRSHRFGRYETLAGILNDEQKEMLAFPDNWDDLVTDLLETPSIFDYMFIQRQPAPGAVRLLAAEALDKRSLKLGKQVLAFCSQREEVMGDSGYRGGKSRQIIWPYRQEIGDVLLAEVTKMVHAIHAERGMFVGQA